MARQASEQEIHRRSLHTTLNGNNEDVVKKQVDKDEGHWFTFMLSHPVKKHMSKLELFTQRSSLLVYLTVGALAILLPNVLAAPFGIQGGHHGSGLISLSGVQLSVIGFLYCIFSRAEPRIPSLCVILGTTFERIGVIGACAYLTYRQDLIPASFLLAVTGADFGLSVITLYLWFSTSVDASVRKYISCLTQLMPFKSPHFNKSSSAVQFLGFWQLAAASICIAFPNIANQTLQLPVNDSHDHQRGLVSIVFIGSVAIGCISFCSGGADSKAFNIAAVFYRLAFTIPYIILVSFLQQIPFGLAGYLLFIDVTAVVVIVVSLYMDRKTAK